MAAYIGPCKFHFFFCYIASRLWKFSLSGGLAADGPEGARGWGAVGSRGVT